MLSNLGNFVLLLGIFLSFAIIYVSSQNLKTEGLKINKSVYHLYLFHSTIIIASFLILITAFITSDISIITVYQNSHTLKPLLYKITGTWGNHEGSLLLWLIILTTFSFLFLFIIKTIQKL